MEGLTLRVSATFRPLDDKVSSKLVLITVLFTLTGVPKKKPLETETSREIIRIAVATITAGRYIVCLAVQLELTVGSVNFLYNIAVADSRHISARPTSCYMMADRNQFDPIDWMMVQTGFYHCFCYFRITMQYMSIIYNKYFIFSVLKFHNSK